MSQQLVLYFVQGESGESEDAPNAFKIPLASSSKTTFESFMKYFPLKSSEKWHFRFREDDAANGYVWRVIFLSEMISFLL